MYLTADISHAGMVEALDIHFSIIGFVEIALHNLWLLKETICINLS
jgi:hypothetical protein